MGKAEILQQWLEKGKNELRSAEHLSDMHHPTPDEVICFLCQQLAEKYIKAFIFTYSRIHGFSLIIWHLFQDPRIFTD